MNVLNLTKEEKEKLRASVAPEGTSLQILGYTVNLETGEAHDLLSYERLQAKVNCKILSILLSHYSTACPSQRTGALVKFGDLPGGHAYETAFAQRAEEPIARVFGDKPRGLIEAAKLLDGEPLSLGDSSVEIPALKGIPLVYVLWEKSEFPASANILFDTSAKNYLPTEDLAVLAELTTNRLETAWENRSFTR